MQFCQSFSPPSDLISDFRVATSGRRAGCELADPAAARADVTEVFQSDDCCSANDHCGLLAAANNPHAHRPLVLLLLQPLTSGWLDCVAVSGSLGSRAATTTKTIQRIFEQSSDNSDPKGSEQVLTTQEAFFRPCNGTLRRDNLTEALASRCSASRRQIDSAGGFCVWVLVASILNAVRMRFVRSRLVYCFLLGLCWRLRHVLGPELRFVRQLLGSFGFCCGT